MYIYGTIVEVTQVRYGPTFRDIKNILKIIWKMRVKQKHRLTDTSKTSARRNPVGKIPLLYGRVTIRLEFKNGLHAACSNVTF